MSTLNTKQTKGDLSRAAVDEVNKYLNKTPGRLKEQRFAKRHPFSSSMSSRHKTFLKKNT